MPAYEFDDFRKMLLFQLSVDFAVLSKLSAEAARRREEKMRLDRNELFSPRKMPADAVRVASTPRAVFVEMYEREQFFKKHGLKLMPVAEIRVPPSLSSYEKERARLAMDWYNADNRIARALAARKYLIFTKGWVGLMHVWFNGSAQEESLDTGPTLFDLVKPIADLIPVDRDFIPVDRTMSSPERKYPKIESPF
ncbi:hypothetical protein WME94_57695 [Sorangium sp. So ce429]